MSRSIVVLASANPTVAEGCQARVETSRRGRLARSFETERTWTLDREAMAAALRVVLGLPRVLPAPPVGETR